MAIKFLSDSLEVPASLCGSGSRVSPLHYPRVRRSATSKNNGGPVVFFWLRRKQKPPPGFRPADGLYSGVIRNPADCRRNL